MKSCLSKTFILIIVILIPFLKTTAQQLDSVDFYKGKIISGNKYLNTNLDSIKDLKNDLLNEIGISPSGDKLVLIRPAIHLIPADLKEPFTLWLVNLKTKQVVLLAKSEYEDFGIVNPSWSPDEKWISFGSFSIGGHSPATAMQSWIVDSSGEELQHIKLPGIFGRFSNSVSNWAGKHNLIIHGTAMQYQNGKWQDMEANFSFDCDTRIIRVIK
jgi:hypothetical protein